MFPSDEPNLTHPNRLSTHLRKFFLTAAVIVSPATMVVEEAKLATLMKKATLATSGKEAPTMAMPVQKTAEIEASQRMAASGQANIVFFDPALIDVGAS